MDIIIPFVILGYGEFKISKLLFSYERNGINTLPVFTSIDSALVFAGDMMTIMKREFDDHRNLTPNICSDRDKAMEMLDTIALYESDLRQIIIDPSMDLRIIDNVHDIRDIIEQLQSGDGSTTSSKIE